MDAPRCTRADVDVRLHPASAASDEEPTAHEVDCLWLLTFAPDQVHSSPLRGPLVRRRRHAADPSIFLRDIRRAVKGGRGKDER